LEVKYFRLSRSTIEYMKCDFSDTTLEEGMIGGMIDSMVMWYTRKTHFTTSE
jgi:hypothetical protein